MIGATTLLRAAVLHPWATKAAALALAAALLMVVWFDGSRSGAAAERVKAAQATVATERAAQAAYAKGMQAGAQRAAELQQTLSASTAFTTALQQGPAHAAPITVARTSACRPVAAHRAAIHAAPHAGAVAQPPQPAPAAASAAPPPVLAERADAGPADPGADHLTAGAVSLWNSALRGVPLASGACGTADAPDGACAAAAPGGLTVAHAWANHLTNAQLCRDNSARHQALIDHLHQVNTLQQGSPTP